MPVLVDLFIVCVRKISDTVDEPFWNYINFYRGIVFFADSVVVINK